MAEVGLLPFARIALQVSKAVLPRYRSRFSKHQFNQPQLLAVLCLMRYEDWTFREAEVRLGEHRELRQALGLGSVPDFTTLYRFLQRLDDVTIDRAVGETVRRLRGTRRKGRRRARVAVDATVSLRVSDLAGDNGSELQVISSSDQQLMATRGKIILLRPDHYVMSVFESSNAVDIARASMMRNPLVNGPTVPQLVA